MQTVQIPILNVKSIDNTIGDTKKYQWYCINNTVLVILTTIIKITSFWCLNPRSLEVIQLYLSVLSLTDIIFIWITSDLSRNYTNKIDNFCFISGEVTFASKKWKIAIFVIEIANNDWKVFVFFREHACRCLILHLLPQFSYYIHIFTTS